MTLCPLYLKLLSQVSRRLSARAWMLALLPYVVWGIVGSAPHLHNVDGGEISSWNATVIQHIVAQSSTRSQQGAFSAPSKTHLATEKAACLLCQWSSHASSVFASPALVAVLHQRSSVFCDVFVSLPRRAILQAANRGPPALS